MPTALSVRRVLTATLIATAVSGVVDILYAIGLSSLRAGVPPERILQSVAAGLLGGAAYTGGTATATLGLALHFLIMMGMAAVFMSAAARWPALTVKPLLAGFAYGLVTCVAMNFVVIPLSAIGRFPAFTPARVASTLFAHVVLVGLPFAFIARRWLPAPAPR